MGSENEIQLLYTRVISVFIVPSRTTVMSDESGIVTDGCTMHNDSYPYSRLQSTSISWKTTINFEGGLKAY
jgi:hypothetical protein